MFSPISQRSWRVRSLYLFLYALLIFGGMSMVIPFMIMITGSVEVDTQASGSLFPSYFFNRQEMWRRYLTAKYQGRTDNLRSSWGDSNTNFRNVQILKVNSESIRQWEKFLKETQPPIKYFQLAFLRSSRMPSYTGREFRLWLMKKFHTLENLNQQLRTQFSNQNNIEPPFLNIIGAAWPTTPMLEQLFEFSTTLGNEFLVPWNVGGYYRGVYLPSLYGDDIQNFNKKHGTAYTSYTEIPFTRVVSKVTPRDWLTFVQNILSPEFVELTEPGKVAQNVAGIDRNEFIRTQALPEHLSVQSLDVQYEDWVATKYGVSGVRIPQQALDMQSFTQKQSFWKWQFIILNYQRVLDEILIHGRAITNTIILVILTMSGALLVNPLAAYALSRFKLRQTYHILLFCLATIAFPAEVTMIPVFLQLKEFHLLNTFGALVLPGLASGFSIFLLKGFFDSLPKELYEAAELDGANEWTMFWQIGMNLSKPILAVIALGAFTAAYGTFFYALILAPDPKMWTIMVYIYQLRSMVDSPVVYASLVLTAIPTLLVFIFCQNIILRGIVVPSDK